LPSIPAGRRFASRTHCAHEAA